MFEYLAFLIAGAFIGLKGPRSGYSLVDKAFVPLSIIILLFFMGVGIGKDPELSGKITGFGINAVVITLFAIAGSVLASAGLLALFGKKS